jgi:hypothetical protein
MAVPHPLVDMFRSPAVNRLSEFASVAAGIRTSDIGALYSVELANAPKRHARGASSQGNASRICCMVHSCVGCSVTPKCRTRRRSCASATKTNRTRKVAIGSEKIDGRGLRQMICQEGSPSLGRRFAGTSQISGHRGLRHGDPQLEQFSVNAGVHPTRDWLGSCAVLNLEC